MKSISLILILSLALLSCQSDSARDHLLQPEKMQAVLSDYLKSEIYINDFLARDSARRDSFEMAVAQEHIFSKHGVSRRQFIYSFEYYSEHGDEFLPILDSMLARRGEERTVSGKEREKLRLFKQQK